MSGAPGRNDLASLAAAIAGDLCSSTDAAVEGTPATVATVVEQALRQHFRTEAEIVREAEQALADLGSSAAGMDRGKLLAGLRDRIAKRKGFVL